MSNNNILETKNLRISFRTNAGLIKAVRNINFELKNGETLAIVGESGSGKSVTSRAILGISAGNAIIESGEIIYDGQDLLKISEEDFHKIRGEKIAMIFQDPLSALNPIVKIGKQLTEAMIIKNKATRKNSRKIFNNRLALINEYMDLATDAANDPKIKEANALLCKTFDDFEYKHLELEGAYNVAKDSIAEAIYKIDSLNLLIERQVASNIKKHVLDICKLASSSINPFTITSSANELNGLCDKLRTTVSKSDKASSEYRHQSLIEYLNSIKEILQKADMLAVPEFFPMAYYLTFCSDPLPKMEITDLNKFLTEYHYRNFMGDFITATKKALRYSFDQSIANKKNAIIELTAVRKKISNYTILEKNEVAALNKHIAATVKKSIDSLQVRKDSLAYTINSSIDAEIKRYFVGLKSNKRKQKEFEKKQRKAGTGNIDSYDITDLEVIKENIVLILDTLREHYEEDIRTAHTHDFDLHTQETINFLRNTAAAVVKRVTKETAKIKALKIMDEVGIPEPSKRYKQYPFQFSGGMRQRIVIAIALTANPQILICDEPTTALDVTIQAQILELINRLKQKHGLSIIFITHDLGVVANMADRIAVMYAGKIVEYGTANEIFNTPAHPYTWALLSSMPDLDTKEKLEAIPGTPPNMLQPPKGDAFAPRNKAALKIDFEEEPPLFKITDTHYAATWLLHPNAPKVEPPRIVTERIERNRKLHEQRKNEAEGN